MFPQCNSHYTMEKPFSGHFLLSPLDSSFFPFPFPAFHQLDDGFNDVVFGETDRYSTTPSTQEPAAAPPSVKKVSGRKRSLRKDRHSKIRTAQGLRDRRMRLSLDVAPEFFKIQDTLGFDKASKTLRWLITAAKPAIQELVSASELESGDSKGKSAMPPASCCHPANNNDIIPKVKRASRRPPPASRRAAFPATIARESRIKARERARERTEKKSLLQYSSSSDHNNLLCNSSLGSDRLVEEQLCSHSPGQQQEVTIFDYSQSSMCPNETAGNLFHEQWYMEDMQLQSRLWEA